MAALVFCNIEGGETLKQKQREEFSFITHIPDDMEDDGLHRTGSNDVSEEVDINAILEETEGENIWSNIFQSN